MTPTTAATSPPWLAIVLAVLTLLAGGGGIGAYVGSRVTLRLGIKADERQARADERTADSRFADQLMGRITTLEAKQAEDDARIESLEQARRDDGDYIEVLKHHIWRGDPPPPPARPPRSSQ
jgi:hypothetical protein